MAAWTSRPREAWCSYIKEHAKHARWIEDGKPISQEIRLRKRELLTLILFSYARDPKGNKWLVGYDHDQGEPNDGFITDTQERMLFEHKVVTQMESSDPLDAVLNTYTKTMSKGSQYADRRILVIHSNKATKGAVKISELSDLISKEECPFDMVFTLTCTAYNNNGRIAVMHLIQHFPLIKSTKSGTRIIQIDFDLQTGETEVPHCGVNWV